MIFNNLFIKKTTIVTIVTLAIAYLMSIVSRPILNLFVSEVDPLDFYYNFCNADNVSIPCENICIVDLSRVADRAAIADVITKVNNCNPQMILLDVIFAENHKYSDLENSKLYQSLQSCSNIAVASRIVESGNTGKVSHRIEHSFFTESLNIKYGLVNYQDTHDFCSYMTYDGQNVPMLYCVSINDNVSFKRKCVDYRNRRFIEIDASQDFSGDDIEGKIVIIGDLYDYQDYHDLSFKIYNQKRLSGTVLIAYATNSIVNNEWIHRANHITNLIVSLIIVFLFTALFIKLEELEQRTYPDALMSIGFGVILKPLVIFIIELVILPLLYAATLSLFNVAINYLYIAISIVMVGTSVKIVNFVIK